MDVTCPNCGALNRNTSRFCARCGQALVSDQPEYTGSPPGQVPSGAGLNAKQNPQEAAGSSGESAASEQGSAGGLNLSWLQAVQDRAVKQTGELSAQKLADIEAQPLGQSTPPAGAAPPSALSPAEEPPPADTTPEQAVPTPAEAGNGVVPAEAPHAEGPAVPVQRQPPSADAQPVGTSGAPDEPPPDWVVGILEPGNAPPASTEQAYEPEEMEHIMPWMSDSAAQRGDATTAEAPPGLPPWLGGITVQETLQSRGPEAEQAAPQAVPELEAVEIQPFEPPVPEEQPQAEQAAKQQEQVPDWLKSLATKDAQPAEEQPTLDRTSRVTQVVLGPVDTLGEPVLQQIRVRPPRPGSVETLAALMQAPPGEALRSLAPAAAVPGAARETARRGIVQWLLPDGLIYLLVLAALLTVLMARLPLGQLNPAPSPGVLDFHNAIEAVPANRPVLLVFDWDASRMAEMALLSEAVTRHVMSRRLIFVTVSTVPFGPGFAQEVTRAAAEDFGYEYGRDYLVLGYLPGNEAAMSALADDFGSALHVDYVNGQSIEGASVVSGGRIESLQDFGLIVNLASDEAALRNWVEQVSTRVDAPIVAAVPQGLEPVARAYKDVAGVGLQAVVSGQAGAMQYNHQLSLRGPDLAPLSASDIEARLNAQSVAQILLALTILAAFVSLGLRKTLRRQS